VVFSDRCCLREAVGHSAELKTVVKKNAAGWKSSQTSAPGRAGFDQPVDWHRWRFPAGATDDGLCPDRTLGVQSIQRTMRRSIYRLPFLKTAIVEAELFAQHRQVKRRSKIIAQTFAWAAVGVGLLLHWPLMILLIVVAAALGCSAFMWWVDGVPADAAAQPARPLNVAVFEEPSESPS